VDELREVNCISDVDNIIAGRTIFVPRVPVLPIPTSAVNPVPSGNLSNRGCTSQNVVISAPIAGQRFSSTFALIGNATASNFWYYKIEIRPNSSAVYNFYLDSYTAVAGSTLGQVNPTIFDKGLHWIRVSVVDLTGGIQTDAVCEVPVIFE
jgi:hypothetical protein